MPDTRRAMRGGIYQEYKGLSSILLDSLKRSRAYHHAQK